MTMVEEVLERVLEVGLVISLTLFTLGLALSMAGLEEIRTYPLLVATITLLVTPLCGVVAITIEQARGGDRGGLFIALILLLVALVAISIAFLNFSLWS